MKLKVKLQDAFTIVLEEDGKKGDIIDLKELSSYDDEVIRKLFEEGKEKVYSEKLAEKEKAITKEFKLELEKKDLEIENLKKEKEKDIESAKKDVRLEYQKNTSELESRITDLQNESKFALEVQKANFENKIKELEGIISNFNENKEKDIEIAVLNLNKERDNEVQELENKYKEQLQEATSIIEDLRREKASKNNKLLGEDLETWCDAQVKEYMQNGLSNCDWYKDSEVVKEDGESKGSKADFILNIYEDDTKSYLLSNVCLEMKNQSPDSKNTHKDEDFFNQLDKNRKKKNCKYAVLVSELGNNDYALPIYKVKEYEDMYVCRSAYMMTLLNLLVSLNTKFANLIKQDKLEEINIREKEEFLNTFESLKKTYLENPLNQLEDHIKEMSKQSENIKKAANKIDDEISFITRNYIDQIENKLNKFEVNMEKNYKKI